MRVRTHPILRIGGALQGGAVTVVFALEVAMPDAALRPEAGPLVTTTFRVGRRYRCTMTIPRPEPGSALAMACAWEPSPPKRLNEREMRDYRRGRNAALSEAARLIGANVLCVEV